MISACSAFTSSARCRAVSASACGILAAGVPSSGEKGNTPARSIFASRRNSQSSSNSASPSPGRPVMRLVRSTRPGMRERSFFKSARMSAPRSRRFIFRSMLSLMCWMGMSTIRISIAPRR